MGYASVMVYVEDVDSADSRVVLACDLAKLFDARLEPLRHRQTKGAANRYAPPKAAAPHSYSTNSRHRLDVSIAQIAAGRRWKGERAKHAFKMGAMNGRKRRERAGLENLDRSISGFSA